MASNQREQKFCLRWNDFHSNIVTSFKNLRSDNNFTDVTLISEGQSCKAHKVVLSACSPYFKKMFQENPCAHPIVILKDVPLNHLQSILEFMYVGEVNIPQESLPTFLKTAEQLQVKGLAEVKDEVED